jgi:hypothetical protein
VREGVPLVILMEDGSLIVDEIQSEEDEEDSPQDYLIDTEFCTTVILKQAD